MKLSSPASRKKARIEIIPLIDIVFFLLATFVMVSLSMVKSQGVKVHLPQASTGTRQEAGDKGFTVITVTENGEIFFNKKKIRPEELPSRFQEIKSREAEPSVLLNGDDKAMLGRAVFVLDAARKAGIKKFALGTRQSE